MGRSPAIPTLYQWKPNNQPVPYAVVEMKPVGESPATVLMPKVKAIDVIGGED